MHIAEAVVQMMLRWPDLRANGRGPDGGAGR